MSWIPKLTGGRLMKRFVIFLVTIIGFLFYSISLAGKPQEEPNYRGLPLKAIDTCIEACGDSPDGEDLGASYDYQMCVADCHPKINLSTNIMFRLW
jgi:hypothetical protein